MRLTRTKWPRLLVPNCVSKWSAVWPNGVAMTPALAMTTSKGSPFSSSPSAQARTLFRLARSSATSSNLPPLASASFRTCAVAASAFFKSRAAPTTCAPCAASERAVSTPSPAETPVTKIRLPRRLIPDKISSVVEVAPNTCTIVLLLVLARSSSVPTDQCGPGTGLARLRKHQSRRCRRREQRGRFYAESRRYICLLEFVAGPQCPVIEVAAWLTLFDKLARVKNSVVGLKPQVTIRLPAHFRAWTVSDEACIALSCRNNQKSGDRIHSISQTLPPLKDPIDGGSHAVRQRCFSARVYVNKVDGAGASRRENAKIIALGE